MDSKKAGLLFIVIGVLSILSLLIYPHLSKKTETAVPVLKSFSDSSISIDGSTANTAADNSEIWENSAAKPATEVSLPDEEPQSEAASTVVFPIDINAATIEELTQIKGIGKALAENIVSYRESFGYFHSMEDLMNVDGISNKRFANLKDCVYISEEFLFETTAAVQETVPTAVSSSATVTTVPTTHSSASPKQTSVKTKVTTADETEDIDDGRIIEEITDFEDNDQSITNNNKATDNSFSDAETTSEEYCPNFPLELNTASARDLACIKGVGDTLAQRIVEYARNYGFYDVNDLLKVSGIGQNKLNGILPYVYVDTSGLPPKTETTASSFYDDFWNNNWGTSDASLNSTTVPAAPEIYKVNVNTASKADFMQLPGIDEALADSIISLRSQIGGFANIEELSLADGMTNSKLSAIWNYIYV